MLEEIIQQRIESLPTDYQEFLFGSFINELVRVYSESFQFSEEKSGIFENGVFLFLLFFLDETTLKNFYKENLELEEVVAEELAYAVISSLPPDLRAELETIHENLKTIPSGNVPSTTTPQPIIQVPIKKPELPATVVRTMSHDMATIRPGSEAVYRAASQADILNKDLPTQPMPDASPRWESDKAN